MLFKNILMSLMENQTRLQGSYIGLYPTHNEGKSVVVERFITTLKKLQICDSNIKIYDLNTNDTYNKTIKIRLNDGKASTHIYSAVRNNDKDPKFEVGDHV